MNAGEVAGVAFCRNASNSTSAGRSGATGFDTMTFCTSCSDRVIAAVTAGKSAPETSTAWAREFSSMYA
jgi:hypothetical protein